MTHTPASGPRGPVTTPPMSSRSICTAARATCLAAPCMDATSSAATPSASAVVERCVMTRIEYRLVVCFNEAASRCPLDAAGDRVQRAAHRPHVDENFFVLRAKRLDHLPRDLLRLLRLVRFD